jgi:hypothetical protein
VFRNCYDIGLRDFKEETNYSDTSFIVVENNIGVAS